MKEQAKGHRDIFFVVKNDVSNWLVVRKIPPTTII